MKIAISNIAWTAEEDEEVYAIMQEKGVKGLEVAPTRIWEKPYEQPQQIIEQYHKYINNKDIEIIAMQALLFGRPDLKIFDSREKRDETFEYLKKNIILGSQLGAKALIFGSPRNRIIGDMDRNKAMDIAVDFFSRLGDIALQNNVKFCIESNPEEYGTDFIYTTKQGLELVKEVNNEGFKLNIDVGAMTINGENYREIIEEVFPYIAHFHISEPHLKHISNTKTEHLNIAKILKKLNYKNWVSIEMKSGLDNRNTEAVEKTLDFIMCVYN